MRIFKIIPILNLLIVIFLSACNNKSTEEKPKANNNETSKKIVVSMVSIRDIGLKIETAENKIIKNILKAPARIITNQDNEAQVGSLLQGRVSGIFVKLGDYVKKDRELLHIVGLEIGEIESHYLTARANLIFMEGTLKRQKSLVDQKVGSQKALLEAQAEYDKSLAEYNADHKKLHSIGLDEADLIKINENEKNGTHFHTGGVLSIKSPIDGIIVERNVVMGQLVDVSTNCFKIVNTNTLWADAQIYEKDIPLINNNSEISVEVSAYPNEKFTGKIIYVSEIVDEKTRTIKVRALIPNTNRKLKPEMFAEMSIPEKTSSDGIAILQESILKDGNTDIIFIALNDTTFEKRTVEIGPVQNDFVQILNGIKAGERVVTKGSFFLKSELKKETFGESD